MSDLVSRFRSMGVKPAKLLERLLTGHLANVDFRDFVRLVEALGFQLLHAAGSHRIYGRPGVAEQLSLQSHRGDAKPYQIRQLLALVRVYNLSLRSER